MPKFKRKAKTMVPQEDHYVVYTDGSALGNPGPGGYGCVIIYDKIVVEMSAGYFLTTNNRQEIMSVIAALEEFGPGKHFTICTDSQYVIDGSTSWLKGWIRNNWMTYQAGTPVKNADLWKIMEELLKLNKVTFFKVKAHIGDPLNERADDLAKQGARAPTLVDEEYKLAIESAAT